MELNLETCNAILDDAIELSAPEDELENRLALLNSIYSFCGIYPAGEFKDVLHRTNQQIDELLSQLIRTNYLS